MPSSTLTRRALLAGAGTTIASAAIAVPYVAAAGITEPVAAEPEAPGDRLNRLMQEISQILDDALFGTFCAVIEPSKHERAQVALRPIRDVRNATALAHFVEHAPHHALVEYHLGALAKAMRKRHGGCWVAHAQEGGGAQVHRDHGRQDGVWVSFPVEC